MSGQNTCQGFEAWSNGYDGKIDLVTNANKGVNDYFNSLGWNCPPTSPRPCREQTLPVIINGNRVNRRLDIYNSATGYAKEFKEYYGGKVYRSDDIVNEVLRDKQLMADRVITDMEWVFKGCEPSGPLEILLKSGPNPIKIVKIP